MTASLPRRMSLALGALLSASVLGMTATTQAQAAQQHDGVQTARPSTAGAPADLRAPIAAKPLNTRLGASASGLLSRGVYFRNGTGETVWVAIMRYEPSGCAGYGNFQTKGWWRLEPGQAKRAMNTSSRYAYYYAHTASGVEWTGDYGPVYVYHRAFDSCVDIGSTAAYGTVGMRSVDLNWAGVNHTINLAY